METKLIDTYVKCFLQSEKDEYVVFDCKAEKTFEGTLIECVARIQLGNPEEVLFIYSKENYERMLEVLRK